MNRQFSCSECKLDRVMTQEQFSQVVEAILEGKYSWACVLILQFAGYNPLHYIPYRTYNRLTKENYKAGHRNRNSAPQIHSDRQSCELETAPCPVAQNASNKIDDLSYLEVVGQSHQHIQGGTVGLLEQPLDEIWVQHSFDYRLSGWI